MAQSSIMSDDEVTMKKGGRDCTTWASAPRLPRLTSKEMVTATSIESHITSYLSHVLTSLFGPYASSHPKLYGGYDMKYSISASLCGCRSSTPSRDLARPGSQNRRSRKYIYLREAGGGMEVLCRISIDVCSTWATSIDYRPLPVIPRAYAPAIRYSWHQIVHFSDVFCHRHKRQRVERAVSLSRSRNPVIGKSVYQAATAITSDFIQARHASGPKMMNPQPKTSFDHLLL